MKNVMLPICGLAWLSATSFAQQRAVVHYHASIDVASIEKKYLPARKPPAQ